jgi:hypothetical protein
LRIRHPIIGRLLSRTIDPLEGDVPYKPLIQILRKLTTKDDDLWFAGSLVSHVGKYFKRRAQGFSLETDTPMQRAARGIFSAIPRILKETNRALMHHEARYHMHVLHACIDALAHLHTTTLKKDEIEKVLMDEYSLAKNLLEGALAIDDPSEPEKYILNTLALLNFNFAAAASNTSKEFAERFSKGVDLQEDAIGYDPVEALARYQFVREIFQQVPSGSWTDVEKLELYARAELRFQELIKIVKEDALKNIDPVDAEIQIAQLFEMYRDAMSRFPNVTALVREFKVQSPESGISLGVRKALGELSLREGFARGELLLSLRELRCELESVSDKSARGLLLLYRMFVDDPEGRVQYQKRLSILAELKIRSQQQYLPYWHDEAALLCQLDNLERGAARFAELRSFRRGQRVAQQWQWFWVNERALLRKDGTPNLRQVALTVKDAVNGIAEFRGTGIRIRYQPYQFPELKEREVFPAFIRFTLSGMQAVSEPLAETDLEAMGLS